MQPRRIDDIRRPPTGVAPLKPTHKVPDGPANFHTTHSRKQLVNEYERFHRAHAVTTPVKIQTKHIPQKDSFFNSSTIAYDFLLFTFLGYIAAYTGLINWVILIYTIYVLVRRLPSQRVFMLALGSLILIPILTAINRTELANAYAVIAFFMLCVGLLAAIVELKFSPQADNKF